MPLVPILRVGAQHDVGGGVVRVGVHRVRAVQLARGREADIVRIERDDTSSHVITLPYLRCSHRMHIRLPTGQTSPERPRPGIDVDASMLLTSQKTRSSQMSTLDASGWTQCVFGCSHQSRPLVCGTALAIRRPRGRNAMSGNRTSWRTVPIVGAVLVLAITMLWG